MLDGAVGQHGERQDAGAEVELARGARLRLAPPRARPEFAAAERREPGERRERRAEAKLALGFLLRLAQALAAARRRERSAEAELAPDPRLRLALERAERRADARLRLVQTLERRERRAEALTGQTNCARGLGWGHMLHG